VIAMSEEEIVQLTRGDAWKRLCPFDDQIWLQFYADGQPGEPIAIYASQVLRRAVATDAFWGRFVPVLADLAKKIRASVDSEPRAPAYPTVAAQKPAPTPEEERLVRVYIEADPEQRKYSEALGREIATCWDRVVARLKIDPVLYLRPTGLPMTEIDQRPLLDDADGVVLLWSKKTPDAVAAQIKKVEPKLTGPTPAPGLIAYMRENADDQPAGASVGNWNVVRFGTGEDGAAQVDAGDIDTLEAFLTSILARKRR
jgi:hypothetical protein